jgi:hypothetical protein
MDTMKLNKIAAAILLAGVVAMTTGFVSRLIHPAAGGGHGGAGHDEKRVLAAIIASRSSLLVLSPLPGCWLLRMSPPAKNSLRSARHAIRRPRAARTRLVRRCLALLATISRPMTAIAIPRPCKGSQATGIMRA